jgi:hypothetical protein
MCSGGVALAGCRSDRAAAHSRPHMLSVSSHSRLVTLGNTRRLANLRRPARRYLQSYREGPAMVGPRPRPLLPVAMLMTNPVGELNDRSGRPFPAGAARGGRNHAFCGPPYLARLY